MKWTNFLLALCLIGLVMPGALRADEEPARPVKLDAQDQALLDGIIERFSDLQSMKVRLVQTMKMTGMPGPGDMSSTIDFSVKQPNLYRVEATGAMGSGATIVSDGEHQYTYYAMFDRYIKSDAPATLRELGDDPMRTMGADEGAFMFIMPLLAPEKLHDSLKTVQELELVGEEDIDGVTTLRYRIVAAAELSEEEMQDAPPEMVMMMENLSKLKYDVWIQPEPTPLPRRIDWDMTEMMRNFMSDMPADMRPDLDELKVTMSIEYSDWTFNADFDDDHFAFVVPESAEEASSFMEMLQAGMPGGQPSELLGREAPDFTLEMVDGRSVNLSEHRGKDIVVLDFWATWCGPCIAAMPDLIDVTDAYADQNVVFYAINQQEDADRVNNFIRDREWDIKVPLDANGEVARDYKVTGIPQTVIIHTDGTVQAVHVGMVPKHIIEEELKTLLAGERLAEEPEEDAAEEEQAGTTP